MTKNTFITCLLTGRELTLLAEVSSVTQLIDLFM